MGALTASGHSQRMQQQMVCRCSTLCSTPQMCQARTCNRMHSCFFSISLSVRRCRHQVHTSDAYCKIRLWPRSNREGAPFPPAKAITVRSLPLP